ncbi:methyltransferase [Nonomuraea sp. SYSU D8015]|uniref:methyltransferase n=1 Tax=Nonomuraea sp. SYSU D8015 TaxID=2593644 RepID=UPI001660962A|nr:methyltransferase [Nonomuraea sp. SYSU D8015]
MTDYHDLSDVFAAGSPDAGQRAMSPQQALQAMITGADIRLKTLWAFVTLGIATFLKDGSLSSDDIAAACQANRSMMRRFLNAVHAYGLVGVDEQGHYGLTALGRALLPGEGSMWAAVGVTMAPLWQEAGERLPETIRTGRPAVLQGHATPYPILAGDPRLATMFDMFMAGRSLAIGRALAERDYSGVRTVVDVGGGTGDMLAKILHAHEHLNGVLVERPSVTEHAELHLAEQGLDDRVRIIPADMFNDACPSADVIILSSVVHNHATADNRVLLSHIREALEKAGTAARLWCIEALLGEPGVYSSAVDLDMRMMSLFAGGQERTLEQYRELMRLAGLDIVGTEPLPNDHTLMIAQPSGMGLIS